MKMIKKMFILFFVLIQYYVQGTEENEEFKKVATREKQEQGSNASTCARGWFGSGSSCYTLVPMKQSWANAQAVCHTSTFKNGTLAEFETSEEYSSFVALLTNSYEFVFRQEMFWLGATYMSLEGAWVWSTSGSPLSYDEGWLTGATPPHNGSTNCMAFGLPTNNKLDQLQCNTPHFFVCETHELSDKNITTTSSPLATSTSQTDVGNTFLNGGGVSNDIDPANTFIG